MRKKDFDPFFFLAVVYSNDLRRGDGSGRLRELVGECFLRIRRRELGSGFGIDHSLALAHLFPDDREQSAHISEPSRWVGGLDLVTLDVAKRDKGRDGTSRHDF